MCVIDANCDLLRFIHNLIKFDYINRQHTFSLLKMMKYTVLAASLALCCAANTKPREVTFFTHLK